MLSRLAIVPAVVLFAACANPPGGSGGRPAHDDLAAVLWMAASAEYYASVEQAYWLATTRLDVALDGGDPSWTAAIEQVGDYQALPPAVVLDVDEGVLDTSGFQARLLASGDRFDVEVWNDWVREARASALPGALDFVRDASGRGLRIFYVTNRDHSVEEATRRNLQALGFPVDRDGANLLTLDERAGWDADKTSRRRFLAETHRIVLIVGDDLNDFVAGAHTTPEGRLELARRHRSQWGTRWIMLPNPVYGGWERSFRDFDDDVSAPEIRRRKWEAIEALD